MTFLHKRTYKGQLHNLIWMAPSKLLPLRTWWQEARECHFRSDGASKSAESWHGHFCTTE